MNRIRRLVPGHDFNDDLSVVPRYSTPCTELVQHDELFGQLPEILDPKSTIGLGLRGPWLPEEQWMPSTPPPEQVRASESAYSAVTRATPRTYFDSSDFDASSELIESEYQIYDRPKWADRMKVKLRRIKPKPRALAEPKQLAPPVEVDPVPVTALEGANMIRTVAKKSKVLKPLDALGDLYPSLLGFVLVAETALVAFALYEVYVIVNGIIQTLKAILLPLLLLARLFNIQ